MTPHDELKALAEKAVTVKISDDDGWSLSLNFGHGDKARDDMRRFADALHSTGPTILAAFKAQEEVERFREALRFYADWGVVGPHYDDQVHLDSGDIARAALGGSHD